MFIIIDTNSQRSTKAEVPLDKDRLVAKELSGRFVCTRGPRVKAEIRLAELHAKTNKEIFRENSFKLYT